MANRHDYLAVQWHTPKWAWVDPEKDVKAEIMAIRAGLKARSMSINETGQDEEEVDEQIARDNERADRLGLVLDSAHKLTFPLPLTAAAHQIFLAAAAAGLGGEDDSAVIKTYPGVELPKEKKESR